MRRTVTVAGSELAVETYGDPRQPALLLIAGAQAPAAGWDPEFCRRLAAGPRFVIVPTGVLQAESLVGVLDALDVVEAHLVGAALARRMALAWPGRVASLTLLASAESNDDSDSDGNSTGTGEGTGDGTGGGAELAGSGIATLVIRGDQEAGAPAEDVPGVRVLTLAGVGQEALPGHTWPVVVPAILSLTSGGWARQADRLAADSYAAGDPTGWFERLYAAAADGEVPVPWDGGPRRQLVEWAARAEPGAGRRAVVVGCGLGENAEVVAALGYRTLAFDIAPSAIDQARARFPGSTVEYVVGDLLAPPPEWLGAFDLVVEVYTVQALPDPPRAAAIANVARLVAPGGRLLVIAVGRFDADTPAVDGPPFPLTRAELDGFAVGGVRLVELERLSDDGVPRWRATYQRD